MVALHNSTWSSASRDGTLEIRLAGEIDHANADELLERFPGDPDRLEGWRNNLDADLQRRMEEYCFEEMTALGYEPELATGARRLSLPRRLWAQAETYGARLLRAPGEIGRKQVVARLRESLRGS